MSKPDQKALARPWSVPVAVHEVPESGRRFELAADVRARQAVAKLAGVPDILRLETTFDVSPHKQGGLRVRGHVSATVGQTCVVTLEPMESEIEEDVDLVFAPGGTAAPTAREVEVTDEDAPEALIGGTVDLGAIATEFLVLAVDPYPRKPGVVFEPPAVPTEALANPFAALASLKKRQGPNKA